MSHTEEANGKQAMSKARNTSSVIIKLRWFVRSMTLPDQKFVNRVAAGLTIYSPATASADPVISSTIKFKAIKYTHAPKFAMPIPVSNMAGSRHSLSFHIFFISATAFLFFWTKKKIPPPRLIVLGTRFRSWCHPCSPICRHMRLIRYTGSIPKLFNGSRRRIIPIWFRCGAQRLASLTSFCPVPPTRSSLGKGIASYCSLHRTDFRFSLDYHEPEGLVYNKILPVSLIFIRP